MPATIKIHSQDLYRLMQILEDKDLLVSYQEDGNFEVTLPEDSSSAQEVFEVGKAVGALNIPLVIPPQKGLITLPKYLTIVLIIACLILTAGGIIGTMGTVNESFTIIKHPDYEETIKNDSRLGDTGR